MSRRDLIDMLVTAREAAGLTQAQLAAACSVSSQQVSRWERGTAVPGPKVLSRLAAVLSLPEGELYMAAVAASQQEVKQVRRQANEMAEQFRDVAEKLHHNHMLLNERVDYLVSMINSLTAGVDEVRDAVKKPPLRNGKR